MWQTSEANAAYLAQSLLYWSCKMKIINSGVVVLNVVCNNQWIISINIYRGKVEEKYNQRNQNGENYQCM